MDEHYTDDKLVENLLKWFCTRNNLVLASNQSTSTYANAVEDASTLSSTPSFVRCTDKVRSI